MNSSEKETQFEAYIVYGTEVSLQIRMRTQRIENIYLRGEMKFVSIKSSGYHLDSNLDHDEQVLVKIGYWIAQDYESYW